VLPISYFLSLIDDNHDDDDDYGVEERKKRGRGGSLQRLLQPCYQPEKDDVGSG